jgi:tetratricopeptide repeat protein
MRILTVVALLAFTLAPATRAQHGTIDAKESLLTVLTAVNLAGYDAELDSPTNHPLRAQIRKVVASRNPGSLGRLKEFYAEHKLDNQSANLSQFISFALVCDGPPDFGFANLEFDMPPDVQRIQALSPLLAQFYKEADIARIYRQIQPAVEEFAGFYQVPVTNSLFELNGYLRNPTSGVSGREFQIVLSLMAAPNQIHTRSYASNYFVVVSPSAEPQIEDIRYTYLHYVLESILSRAPEEMERIRPLGDYALGAPHLPDHYKHDFQLQATSSLIKAIEARLSGKSPGDQALQVDQAYRRGYVLAPAFYERLSAYEKQNQAMRIYFKTMAEGINLEKEELRAQNLEFDQDKQVRRVQPVVRPEPEQSAAEKAVDRAENLYRERDLDAAREVFLGALRETDDKPLHGRAYYGLARIATLQNDPELAVSLFERALGLSQTPQDRSWTLVYLGRLSDLAGEADKAAGYYEDAILTEGASDKALDMAKQGATGAFREPR